MELEYHIYAKQEDEREAPLTYIDTTLAYGFAHALEIVLKNGSGRKPKNGEIVIVGLTAGGPFKVYRITGKDTFEAPWCDA